MRRNLKTASGVLLACLVWVCGAEAGTGMTVSPSRFRLRKPAGEVVSDKVTITNSGSLPIQIDVETTDMVTRKDENGLSIRDEAPPGTVPHSCARWLQLAEEGAPPVIPPGQSAEVKFIVSPPPDVQSGGYGAYLFFIGKPIRPKSPEEKKTSVQMVTVPRLGVSVVYEVEGTVQRRGELLQLKLTPPTQAQPMKIRHEFKNTGNAEVVLTGSFHILDSQNLLTGKGTLRTLKTFPGETGVAETTWGENLPPGRYKVMITFELGPDADQVIVRDFPLDIAG